MTTEETTQTPAKKKRGRQPGTTAKKKTVKKASKGTKRNSKKKTNRLAVFKAFANTPVTRLELLVTAGILLVLALL